MLSDSRYVDNVVLQKATLQSLLTNIKNYPITDIEYIQEDERDISTDLPIWEDYTDGSPCIKITYGDSETLKGNIIFAESLKVRINEAKKAIITKTNTIADYQNRVSHWNKVYEVNNEIYQGRRAVLDAYGGSISADAMNDRDAIMALGQLVDDLKYGLGQSLSGSWWSPEPNHVYAVFEEQWKNVAQNNYLIVNRLEEYDNRITYYTKNGNVYNEYTYSTAAKWTEDLENEKVYKHYAIFVPILRERSELIAALRSTGYLTPEEHQALIQLEQSVTDYPEYEQSDTVAAAADIITIQQYVTAYLNLVVNAALAKRDAALAARDSLINSATDLTSQIKELRDSINTWNEWIAQIATGRYKLNADGNGIEEITDSSQITDKTMTGYKYVKVGSSIKFTDSNGNNLTEVNPSNAQATGTFRVTTNGHTYDVPIKGLTSGSGDTFNITAQYAVYDDSEKTKNPKVKISDKYVKIAGDTMTGPLEISPNAQGWTQDNVSLNLLGSIAQAGSIVTSNGHIFANGGAVIASTYLALRGYPEMSPNSSAGFYYDGTNTRIRTYNISGEGDTVDFQSRKVYNAVFNDYAEYRKTIDAKPGFCVVDNDDGSLAIANERLMPGAQVISDTFGTCMGETNECKTPLAVAGRVLVYPYKNRKEYHAGMAVCTAPGGTVDIMSREEIKDYPDCIVGIVSEIPDYTEWGSDNVQVDGRIWIKVK